MSDEDVKNVETADQAVASEDEASTLAAIETKMAEMRDGGELTEDDVSSDAEDAKTDQTDTEDQEDVDSKDKDDDSPILPSGHRRAALARGYTNEEIDHYLETKPDEAAARFGELYDERRMESSQWSERGRLLVDAEQKAVKGDEGGDKETPKALSHYDANALAEKHPGSEDLINDLIAPMNAMIDRVNAASERLSNSEEFLQGTQRDALTTATQNFFKSKEMEASKEVYGIEIKDVTDGQMESRMELFAEADIITAGAVAHGQKITVQDALERAFAIVSQGTRDEGIRQEIRDSLKGRTKTTKSSHQRTSATDENQEISEKELEKRTDARLRALRNK